MFVFRYIFSLFLFGGFVVLESAPKMSKQSAGMNNHDYSVIVRSLKEGAMEGLSTDVIGLNLLNWATERTRRGLTQKNSHRSPMSVVAVVAERLGMKLPDAAMKMRKMLHDKIKKDACLNAFRAIHMKSPLLFFMAIEIYEDMLPDRNTSLREEQEIVDSIMQGLDSNLRYYRRQMDASQMDSNQMDSSQMDSNQMDSSQMDSNQMDSSQHGKMHSHQPTRRASSQPTRRVSI
ncbi:MAG: hypothetical protein OXC30_06280 [Alphaproteobacteria bacterium]|nr:hypothetical protein [Alphaproteobacteria bacterium]